MTENTKKNWIYSTDEQETALATELINKACIDAKKTLIPDDKKSWIKRLVACAKANGLTLSSQYSMFYVSFFDDRVATLPSQVARMLIGEANITYNVIFVHKNDKFSYHGFKKINYEKVEWGADYALSYTEKKNATSGNMEVDQFTGVENLLCIQVQVDLGTRTDYPSPMEVKDICRRASMSKLKTIKDCVWLKHFKAMVEKTVALKIAKDYKYYIATLTGYSKPVGESDPHEVSTRAPISQAIATDDFEADQYSEPTQTEIDAEIKPTAYKEHFDYDHTMIEADNLTAEQILALCERWALTDVAIKAKAIKMKEIGVIKRSEDGKLVVDTSFMNNEELARKIILQTWYGTKEV